MFKKYPLSVKTFAAALCCISLLSCDASASTEWAKAKHNDEAPYSTDVDDPIEWINRFFFDVNDALDYLLIEPIATVYHTVIPEFLRDRVHDVIVNLATPVVCLNDLLQGDTDAAGNSLARFALNTTFGVGGVFDAAEDFGHHGHNNDFGKTLAVMAKADDGPYLVLPLLGPTNLRDLTGSVVDYIADPFNNVMRNRNHKQYIYVRQGIVALDERSMNLDTIENIRKTSIDFYATVRSLYKQQRDYAIRGEADVDTKNIDSPKPSNNED